MPCGCWVSLMWRITLSETASAAGAAAAFGLAPVDVCVADAAHLEAAPGIDRAPLLLERLTRAGDYPFSVTVIPRRPELRARVRDADGDGHTLAALARSWSTPLLYADDTADPRAWIRLQPSGAHERVTLDDHALDDDRIVIDRAPVSG